ncbi:MAG: DUF5723 family protein [bacterium]
MCNKLSLLNFIAMSSIALIISVNVTAQIDHSNARSLAMAGAYSAVAQGVEAANWNPAVLGFNSAPVFSMRLPAFGVGVQNTSFSVADYKTYNGAALTAADKQTILSKIPDSGFGLFLNSGANLLGISIYRFALTANIIGASDLRFSKTFADLILNGNAFQKEYDFSDTSGKGYAVAAYSLSYGQPINLPQLDAFAVGLTVRYLQGLTIAEVVSAQGSFVTDFDGFHGDGQAELRTAIGGSGMSVDLGTSARFAKRWTVGLSFRNFYSNINWKSEVKEYTYGVAADSLTAERISESDADSLVDDFDETRDGASFRSQLPLQVLLGAAYTTSSMIYSFEYIQGLSDEPGASRNPQMAFGLEYKGIGFLPLRAGLALGGREKLMTAIGFGLKLGGFSLNFATQAHGGLFIPGTGRGLGLAFDMRIGV